MDTTNLHTCQPNNDSPYSGEFDYAETKNLAQLFAYVGSHRVLYPLVMLQSYLSAKAMNIGMEHLPEDKRQEFSRYSLWPSNLQTDIETGIADISALLIQNMPTKLASIEDMLQTALAESGFCCTEAINQHVRAIEAHQIDRLASDIPEFKPEWLTVQGVKDISI